MATVDEDANAELTSAATTQDEDDSAPSARLESGTPLRLHEAAGPVPLGAGWDAEPVAVDWNGRGLADLLVSAGGGPAGRSARLYRQLEPAGEPSPRFESGVAVEGLDGLRCLSPIPNDGASRFDLVALAPDGLVFLPNAGTADAPRFSERRLLGFTANLGIGPGRVAQIVAEDWDGDGRVDLLIGFDDLEGYWPDQDRAVPRRSGSGSISAAAIRATTRAATGGVACRKGGSTG